MKNSKIAVLVLSLVLMGFVSTPVFAEDKNPLSGYTIHVTAPHVMDGEVMGPFHHYCKPINDDIIQCVLFESTEPNARMTEVEYMVSKKLARSVLTKWSHAQNWHDHKQEIDTGRVVVVNPSDPKEQKGLVDHVSETDGIIFHLWPKDSPIPDGTVSIAQSVGHWEALHGKVGKAMAEDAAKAAKSAKDKPAKK